MILNVAVQKLEKNGKKMLNAFQMTAVLQINTVYRYNILSHLKQNWLSLHMIMLAEG